MSIAERARELVDTINDKCIEWSYGDTVLLHSEAQEAIEHALLAERASVWEQAVKIAELMSGDWWAVYKGQAPSRPYPEIEGDPVRGDPHVEGMSDGGDYVSQALRAAAEKEVGK